MLTFRFLRKSWKVGELNVLQTLKTIPFLHTGKTQTTIKFYKKKSFFQLFNFQSLSKESNTKDNSYLCNGLKYFTPSSIVVPKSKKPIKFSLIVFLLDLNSPSLSCCHVKAG